MYSSPCRLHKGLQMPILALPPLNIVVQEQRPGMTFIVIAAVWLHLFTAPRLSHESLGIRELSTKLQSFHIRLEHRNLI